MIPTLKFQSLAKFVVNGEVIYGIVNQKLSHTTAFKIIEMTRKQKNEKLQAVN